MFGMQIPSFMLKQMYKQGSLENQSGAFRFAVQNPLMDATIIQVKELTVAGQTYTLEEVEFSHGETTRTGTSVSESEPVGFAKGDVVWIRVKGYNVHPGEHTIVLKVHTEEFGTIKIEVQDSVG